MKKIIIKIKALQIGAPKIKLSSYRIQTRSTITIKQTNYYNILIESHNSIQKTMKSIEIKKNSIDPRRKQLIKGKKFE
jgi:ribosomal protein S4